MANEFSVLVSAEFDNSSVKKLQEQIRNTDIKPIEIRLDTSEINNQIRNIRNQIEELNRIRLNLNGGGNGNGGNNRNNNLQQQRQQSEEVIRSYRELMNLQQQINKNRTQLFKLDTSKDIKQIETLKNQIRDLENLFNELYTRTSPAFTNLQLDNLQRGFINTENSVASLNAKLQDTSAIDKQNAEYQRLMQTLKEANKTEFDLTKLKGSEGNTTQITELENRLRSLKSTYQQLYDTTHQSLSSTQMKNLTKESDNAAKKLDTLKAKLQDTKQKQDELLGQKKNQLSNTIDIWAKDNSAALKTFGTDIERIKRELKSCNNTGLDKLKAEFKEIQQQAKLAGVNMKTFGDRIKSAISNIPNALTSSFAMYFNSMTLFTKVFNSIRDGINTVKDLDTALVDLQKTTTASASQLNDFFFEANDVAKKYGSTTQEIIQSASDWSRLGYSLADSKQMAKLSSQMKSISPGMTIDEATNGMVSAMKAYGIEADQVLDGLMSKVNKIGNTAALTNSDIIVGLEHSASAMKAMGSSLEENIALFTAIQEISQNASKSSNALRSVSLRVRGYNEETEELDENLTNITGDVIDLTKVASNNYKGISLFTDETQTEYKDLYQYFKEISEIYDEIAAKPRQELLEKLFGKTRANFAYPYVQQCA